MDRETKLRNVAFGGNWSEDILATENINSVLAIIEKAAEDCAEFDVDCDQLAEAVNFISCNIEKGPMLAAAWRKAIKHQEPGIRQVEAWRVAELMRRFAGV